MPNDRVKRLFRRLKGQDVNKTLHSFPTLRAKPRTEFGWNEFKQSLKNLLKSDLTEASYKSFLAPLLLSEIDHELYLRWLQTICMLPFFREATLRKQDDAAIQASIQLHRELSAYLSSILALSREYKWPILRSLDKVEPDNSKVRSVADSFVLGNALLIAPIVSAGAMQRHVYLPTGRWYSYISNAPYEGSRYVSVDVTLEATPVFVKAGTTLPLQITETTNETDSNLLVYRVYPGELETVLYEDEANSFDKSEKEYRWIYITCGWDEGKLVVTRRIAGQYKPTYTKIRVEIVDLPSEPTAIIIDRRPAPLWYFDDAILEFTTDSFQRIEMSFTSE